MRKKATNQERTSRKAVAFVRSAQQRNVLGPYQAGWNAACDYIAEQLTKGAHLEPPPQMVPVARALAPSDRRL